MRGVHHALDAGEEIIAGLEFAIRNLNPLADRVNSQSSRWAARAASKRLRGRPVDELGAEFHRHALGRVDGPNPAPRAVARLQQENVQARFGQQPGGRETGDTGADDDDIRRSSRRRPSRHGDWILGMP